VPKRERLAEQRKAAGFSQEQLAEQLGVERSTVARWEAGETEPQPWLRPMIAQALGVTRDDLVELLTVAAAAPTGDDRSEYALRHPASVDPGTVAVRRSDRSRTSEAGVGTLDLHSAELPAHLVSVDARTAARFARQVSANAVNELTLEQIDADVRRIARQYVSHPLDGLFLGIRELRTDVFGLIECNRYPEQIRHLHLAASRLCGLQAHVCLDLGHYAEADTHARTAWLCADLAGHQQMRGWVRGLQSLIAYWDGRLGDAVDLAADGARCVCDGSIAARLPALQARAAAALGHTSSALAALEAAEQARSRVCGEEDAGGVFFFPEAKQSAYAGTTLVTLDAPDLAKRAVRESGRAIELYEAAAPLDRSSGDMLAAHLDLAVAHLTGDDLDGTHAELAVVLSAPVARRTASIRKRATRLAARLTAPRYQSATLARQMRDAIINFCVPPALPSGVGKAGRADGKDA
jgi:transcriptional regulator with XRE-family HTH domain